MKMHIIIHTKAAYHLLSPLVAGLCLGAACLQAEPDAAVGNSRLEPLATPPTQPNVIIVLSDDHGYGDIGFTGNRIIKTPNLDQFAREGIRFDNSHPKALPAIAEVQIKISDNMIQKKPVPMVAAMVEFILPVTVGPATVSATFLDANGETVCGGYYIYAQIATVGKISQ